MTEQAQTEAPADAPEGSPPPAEAPPATPAKAAAEDAPAVHVTARDWMYFAAITVVSAVADLWSKHWAFHALSRSQSHPPPLCTPPPGMSHYLYQRSLQPELVLIREYLDLQYAENCGGAFGFLTSASESIRRPFFVFVSIGAIGFIVYLFRTAEPGQRLSKWALPLVLGGAIGNLVDRIRLGYVVDFIHAHWKTRAHWPTFNVADIAITVGIGLMLLEYVIGPKPTKKPAEKPAEKPA
jgi:signal peptidase II